VTTGRGTGLHRLTLVSSVRDWLLHRSKSLTSTFGLLLVSANESEPGTAVASHERITVTVRDDQPAGWLRPQSVRRPEMARPRP
jgi:hypothetical protein